LGYKTCPMRTLLIFITLNVTTMIVQAQTPTRYLDAYSVYITKDLARSKAFYVQWLDFEIAFESTWFIYMQSKGDHKVSFALIDEKHPSTPPAYGAFNGRGSFLTLQVEDAEAVYNKLRALKAPITYALKREDWGQIRFGLTDPNGLYIDVVQQVDPAPGYWDRYMPK
jgi:catechol 2,3-dioxygenase-like lactoylglutathione lyase family enzyme